MANKAIEEGPRSDIPCLGTPESPVPGLLLHH